MNMVKSLIVCCIGAVALSEFAVAADYEGAITRRGNSRGEACEKAKGHAATSAKAAGTSTNTINTSACECDKTDDSSYLSWECTVAWEANAKRRD